MPFAAFAFWTTQKEFAAGASPNSVTGYVFWNGSPPRPAVISGSVTCTAVNGLAPYTYLWQEVGGPSGISATSPTNPNTTFKANPVTPAFSYTGEFRCRVTDSLANIVYSNIVSVYLERNV